jgi:shikimate dehydrogenase
VVIDGNTALIAHLGYPTKSFKAPMIYNPFFAEHKINAVVVPMGVVADDYPQLLRLLAGLTNFHGALVTMPHKVTTVNLLDDSSTAVKIAGSCNAIVRREDGTLLGDMFDGEGFVRGLRSNGRQAKGARVLVTGSGGVGSAIAASLAAAGVAHLSLYDVRQNTVAGLAQRLREQFPELTVSTDSNDPAGHDIVVNATPLGMQPDDPLPIDVDRLEPTAFVGEVVLSHKLTPFLLAAREKGCEFQVGTDMLFEQIPAYLEFMGFGTATAAELRRLAQFEA